MNDIEVTIQPFTERGMSATPSAVYARPWTMRARSSPPPAEPVLSNAREPVGHAAGHPERAVWVYGGTA